MRIFTDHFALTTLLLAASSAPVDAACPPPSLAQGGKCILRADAAITDTIWIPSGTTLDCQGHHITAAIAGVLDNPTTAANEFQPSTPELALLVHNAQNVTIQNCLISGFDFGIIVAQSKNSSLARNVQIVNKILTNTIDVRTNPIDVIQSDDVLISGNNLSYASERGRGIVIDFDSDYNQIVANTITSTGAASTGQVRQLPGGPFVTSTAIMDNKIHCLQADKPLQNFVVSGTLFQVPAGVANTDMEDTARSDHNLITLNTISGLTPGPSCTLDPATSCAADTDCTGKGSCLLKQDSGIAFNLRASDTTVVGNRLAGRMLRGISFGGQTAVFTQPNWYPGKCALNANRICSMDSDCNIPGYDTTSLGACLGIQPATFNGNSLRLTAEANILSGEYDAAALFANQTDTFTFAANLVNSGEAGIQVKSAGINGSIERNIVSGATNALALDFQPTFTQNIQLNDFTNYSAAIQTSNDFTTPTDISVNKGNYWGLPCPGFNPGRVVFQNGSVNPYVVDGKPYGLPVALIPDAFLPKPCQ